MKKSKLTAFTIGAIALGLIATTAGVSAYQGDYTKSGPDHSPEREAVMTQAFESGDYNAWKETMDGKGRVLEVVNEGNFARFAEAHRLGNEGDAAGADAIRSEIGLRTRDGEPLGLGHGEGNGDATGAKDGSGRGNGGGRGQGQGAKDGSGGNADCTVNQ